VIRNSVPWLHSNLVKRILPHRLFPPRLTLAEASRSLGAVDAVEVKSKLRRQVQGDRLLRVRNLGKAVGVVQRDACHLGLGIAIG